MHRYAVCREHCRGMPGEEVGVDAAVVGDSHGGGGKAGLQIVGVALRCLAHGIEVHAVAARAQHAPKPAGAEFQLAVKPLGDLLFLSRQRGQLLPELRVRHMFHPAFI